MARMRFSGALACALSAVLACAAESRAQNIAFAQAFSQNSPTLTDTSMGLQSAAASVGGSHIIGKYDEYSVSDYGTASAFNSASALLHAYATFGGTFSPLGMPVTVSDGETTSAGAGATASWNNEVTTISSLNSSSNTTLTLKFHIEGGMVGSVNNLNLGGTEHVDFSSTHRDLYNATLQPQGGSLFVDQDVFLTVQMTRLPDGSLRSDPWSISLNVSAGGGFGLNRDPNTGKYVGYDIYGTSGFQDTVSLVSVTLPDGSTPESHGAQVTFASGMISPNVVPEPASGLLLACGAVVAGGIVRRRRRGGR